MTDWFWLVSDLLRDFFSSHEGSRGTSCEGRRFLLQAALEGGKADIMADGESPQKPGAYSGAVESMLPSPPKSVSKKIWIISQKYQYISDTKRKLMCLAVAQISMVDIT